MAYFLYKINSGKYEYYPKYRNATTCCVQQMRNLSIHNTKWHKLSYYRFIIKWMTDHHGLVLVFNHFNNLFIIWMKPYHFSIEKGRERHPWLAYVSLDIWHYLQAQWTNAALSCHVTDFHSIFCCRQMLIQFLIEFQQKKIVDAGNNIQSL